jgi:DNA-binding response OmpR family regulator
MYRVLVVEDEPNMRRLIKDFLKKDGYKVWEAENGREALEIFESEEFDLIILDVMMPELDGWVVCREIRKSSQVPIVFLTAKVQESDELFGFELEANDYITKPFSLKVLSARIKALLKKQNNGGEKLKNGDLFLDYEKHTVSKRGVDLELTPKEFDLLLYFMKNKGIALSREKILNKIWGYDYFGDLRTVDTHIKRLRKKIGEEFIETVRGFGYKFREDQ